MKYETIIFEQQDRAACVTLNRPERLNAISVQMITELNDAYRRIEEDPDIWCYIVTGAGDRALCAGVDVGKMPTGKNGTSPPPLATMSQWDAPQEATPPYLQMTKPMICAVNGIVACVGLDLITTSDIAIAATDATFFDPHVSIGIVSGREMVRLARVLPLNVAMRVALMGKHERMTAQRAYDLGLVSELVPGRRSPTAPGRSPPPSTATPRWPCAVRGWPSARA